LRIICFSISAIVAPGVTDTVADRPAADSASLEAKLAWALGGASKAGPGRTFWIGYSVERLTGEQFHVGSWMETFGSSGSRAGGVSRDQRQRRVVVQEPEGGREICRFLQ
jgi:hypothetical protein